MWVTNSFGVVNERVAEIIASRLVHEIIRRSKPDLTAPLVLLAALKNTSTYVCKRAHC